MYSHFQSDLIYNLDHMRISSTEPIFVFRTSTLKRIHVNAHGLPYDLLQR